MNTKDEEEGEGKWSTVSLNKFTEMFAHLRVFSVTYTNCHINC